MKSDERLLFSRGDCDDLSGVTDCCSRSVCDDGAGLARPTGQIGAQLHNGAQGCVASNVKGVGESVARAGYRRRTGTELGGGGIEGVFNSFFHSVAVRVCIECSGCGETQTREVLLIGGEGGLGSV